MSENGSNASIEEIGPEEIEGIGSEEKAQATTENAPSAAAAATPENDDPPLENLEAPPAAAAPDNAPASEAAPAAAVVPEVEPIGEVVEEIARPPQPDPPVQSRQVGVINLTNPGDDDEDDDEEDDDDIDETLTERLIGLTEMFPDSLRSGSVALVKGSWSLTKSAYGMSRSIAWVVCSSAAILFMPIMIETERLSIMDQQKQQKTQMLLGPGVASSGPPSLGPPPI